MAGNVAEILQIRVCTSSFAIMAVSSGSAARRGESLEDLSEFAAYEGAEDFVLGGVEGAMTFALRWQDVVWCEGKAKASSIGGIGDEDIGIDEVVGIFHDADFGSGLFHLHALRRDVISEWRCKIIRKNAITEGVTALWEGLGKVSGRNGGFPVVFQGKERERLGKLCYFFLGGLLRAFLKSSPVNVNLGCA